jgi:CO/xanthine dehydrogenase FAD-binding subunit
MHSSLSRCRLLEPRTLTDALAMLRDEGRVVPMAGCTDLYVALNFGTLRDQRFLDLWRLAALRRIDVRDNVLWIGALATYSDLLRSPLIRARLPMLVSAASQIGGVQIQNRGTIGGNVANGSPAGDTLPVLAVADATIVLRSASGLRRVPFSAFYTGYRGSVMRQDELILGLEIPPVGSRQWFRKVGTRAAQAIAKVVMAGVGGKAPRVALGSVAPTVVRALKTESVLASGGSLVDATRALNSEIAPIDDLRSTAEYRRRVAENLLARFCADMHCV